MFPEFLGGVTKGNRVSQEALILLEDLRLKSGHMGEGVVERCSHAWTLRHSA
jgi:hypothetical protein